MCVAPAQELFNVAQLIRPIMCDEETHEVETVEIPRPTLASAIDLLDDYRGEMDRADATGPYSDELSSTIEQLERRLGKRLQEGDP
jgi:hypothetical protein